MPAVLCCACLCICSTHARCAARALTFARLHQSSSACCAARAFTFASCGRTCSPWVCACVCIVCACESYSTTDKRGSRPRRDGEHTAFSDYRGDAMLYFTSVGPAWNHRYGLRPQNLSVTLHDKNTADAAGDIFFWISDRLVAP